VRLEGTVQENGLSDQQSGREGAGFHDRRLAIEKWHKWVIYSGAYIVREIIAPVKW